MPHGGITTRRKFERQAQDTVPAFGEAIQRDEVEAELRTGRIIVQQTADSVTNYLDPVGYPITITEVGLIGKADTSPTSTTTAYLSAALNLIDSDMVATTTIDTRQILATTSSKIYNDTTTGVAQAVAANEQLSVTWDATTNVDDGASLCIQYTVD